MLDDLCLIYSICFQIIKTITHTVVHFMWSTENNKISCELNFFISSRRCLTNIGFINLFISVLHMSLLLKQKFLWVFDIDYQRSEWLKFFFCHFCTVSLQVSFYFYYIISKFSTAGSGGRRAGEGREMSNNDGNQTKGVFYF